MAAAGEHVRLLQRPGAPQPRAPPRTVSKIPLSSFQASSRSAARLIGADMRREGAVTSPPAPGAAADIVPSTQSLRAAPAMHCSCSKLAAIRRPRE